MADGEKSLDVELSFRRSEGGEPSEKRERLHSPHLNASSPS
jgi:hypothetical protein